MSPINRDPLAGRALTGILRESAAAPALPQRSTLAPAQAVPDQLQRVLARPTTDDFMLDQLRPTGALDALLTPGRLDDTLLHTVASLQALVESHPGAARALGAAARLLDDDIKLRELLHMYRSALLPG
jgi:hypothetical protein